MCAQSHFSNAIRIRVKLIFHHVSTVSLHCSDFLRLEVVLPIVDELVHLEIQAIKILNNRGMELKRKIWANQLFSSRIYNHLRFSEVYAFLPEISSVSLIHLCHSNSVPLVPLSHLPLQGTWGLFRKFAPNSIHCWCLAFLTETNLIFRSYSTVPGLLMKIHHWHLLWKECSCMM